MTTPYDLNWEASVSEVLPVSINFSSVGVHCSTQMNPHGIIQVLLLLMEWLNMKLF